MFHPNPFLFHQELWQGQEQKNINTDVPLSNVFSIRDNKKKPKLISLILFQTFFSDIELENRLELVSDRVASYYN